MRAKKFEEMTPLEKLRSIWGGETNIARQLKLKSPHVIQYWFKVGYIPHCHGTRVMRATKGRIKAIDIWMAAAKERGEL